MSDDLLIEAGKEARAQGDFMLAASLYRQALQANPDNYIAVKRLDWTLVAQSEFNAAAEVYKSAISRLKKQNETGKTLGNLYLSLGETYLELDRLEEAQKLFAKASKFSAEPKLVFESRGNGYLAQKRFTEALGDFEKLIELDPNSSDGYLGKACVYQGKQQYELAAEALRTAETLSPNNHWVEVAWGNFSTKIGDYRDALEHYQKARLIKPYNLSVRYNLGTAYLRLGKYEAAKQTFVSLLEQRPNDPQSLVALAGAEEGLGNERQAIALLKSALLADPSNISYYVALSRVQVASGKVLDAIRTAFQGRKVRLQKR